MFNIPNPIESKTFTDLITSISTLITKISIPFLTIALIYAGFLFLTAGGDQKKIDEAKNTFYWTIIAGIIIIGAYALATAINQIAKSL